MNYLKKIYTDIVENKNIIILTFLYIYGFCSIIFYSILDIEGGGNAWKQGDWLINNEHFLVRRGWLGSVLIYLSNFFELNILYVVLFVQTIVIFVIFLIFFLVGVKYRKNDLFFFLLISPFFILFWFNDPLGSMRKEILGYLAFLPYMLLLINENLNVNKISIFSVFLYFLAVFSHEINVFLLPFFLIISYLINKKNCFKYFIAYFFIAISGFIYSLVYSKVDEYLYVCQPLLDLNLKVEFCGGAIKWLEKDFYSNIIIIKNHLSFFVISKFIILVSILLFTLIYSLSGIFKRSHIFCFYLMCFVCVSPLFFIALDWGRWLNLSLMGFIVVLFIYLFSINNNKKVYVFKSIKYVILILLSFYISVPHLIGNGSKIDRGYYKSIKYTFINFFLKDNS